jgi:hypothetical protein
VTAANHARAIRDYALQFARGLQKRNIPARVW